MRIGRGLRFGVTVSSIHDRTNAQAHACVAQIFNLLYRRFAIGRASKSPTPGLRDGLQNTILRYSRLKICATTYGMSRLMFVMMPGKNSLEFHKLEFLPIQLVTRPSAANARESSQTFRARISSSCG